MRVWGMAVLSRCYALLGLGLPGDTVLDTCGCSRHERSLHTYTNSPENNSSYKYFAHSEDTLFRVGKVS
jgi:hypothetical protein